MQTMCQQDKFVSVIKGKIFDVVVDLRKKSKTYGKYFSIILSEKNSTSLFIPAGFAHGFCGLENDNLVFYGCTNYKSKKNEVGILWNDKTLKIKWPTTKPILSKKDKNNITFEKFNNF
jgi:dTDP-4-dehydrorhamnose 3,5-epimerase